jgi:hypothetical protein
MNLKPYRIYGEEEVINGLFALNATSGDKGSFVTIQSTGWVNGVDFKDVALTSFPNVVSNWRVLKSEVGLAASGATRTSILGVMLRDVRDTNFLGVKYLWDATRKAEREVVLSGEAVPILTRGIILVSGMYSGVGAAGIPVSGSMNLVGQGAVACDTIAGCWKIQAYAAATSCGKFLGSTDADNYALFKLEL